MRAVFLCVLVCALCSLARGGAPPLTLLVVSKFQAEFANYPALVAALEAERMAGPSLTCAHGDSFGATAPASKLLNEEPGVIAMNGLGIQVDSFANQNFNPGVAQLLKLLPAVKAQFTIANIATTVPRVQRTVLLTAVNGARVLFVGALSFSDSAAMDPSVLRPGGAFGFRFPELNDVIAARNEAVAALNPDYVVALLSIHSVPLSGVDRYVAPLTGLFDVICLGLQTDTSYIRTTNGTLVVSGPDFGAGFVRVSLGAGAPSAVQVRVVRTTVSPSAVTESSLWTRHATCLGSAPLARLDAQLPGRSKNRGSAGFRSIREGETALGNLILASMQRLTNSSIAVLNTGAVRDDLPSAFVPTPSQDVRRPQTHSGPPYSSVTGDCITVLPFSNYLEVLTVSSAQLWSVASWSVTGFFTPPNNELAGIIRGLTLDITFFANGSATLNSLNWPDGRAVDPTLTSDRNRIAVISFLSNGGDNFPVFPGVTPTDTQPFDLQAVLCSQLAYAREAGETITPDAYLPFTTRIKRSERVCGLTPWLIQRNLHTMLLDTAAQISLADQLGRNASSPSFCLVVGGKVFSVQDFVARTTPLTTISTALAPPSPYAVVTRRANPVVIVGQLVGDVVSFDIADPLAGTAPVTRANDRDGSPSATVYICAPVSESINVFGSFTLPALAVSVNRSSFFVDETIESNNTVRVETTSSGKRICSNITLPIGSTVFVAAARAAPSSFNYSPVEQAFLFLFGILWLAFTAYVVVLLLHHVWLIRLSGSAAEFFKPASVVRIELILVGICRFLYFVLLPWRVLQNNPLGSIFLFEFPYVLIFSIYTVFVQLFVSLFHWRALRGVERHLLWVPLFTLNVLLFAFFFTVIIVYGQSSVEPSVKSSFVLAYRITLAAVAFLVVIAFAAYGTVLALRVRRTLLDPSKARPMWLAQMWRLLIVAGLASCGVLAIFIVIIYTAVTIVPDPVFSSVAWLILFVFFTEMVPLFAIAHDLHRTALVAQTQILESKSAASGSLSQAAAHTSRRTSLFKAPTGLSRGKTSGTDAASGRGSTTGSAGGAKPVDAAEPDWKVKDGGDSEYDAAEMDSAFHTSKVEM